MSQAASYQPPLELAPRFFNELHTERYYLLNSLQHENEKATELLRNITILEETIAQNGPGAAKNRKQLKWLKRRLFEVTKQERSIMARLGEVAYEIQCRERPSQIENEAKQTQTFNYSMPLPGQLPLSEQFYQHGGAKQDTLNPNSPEFVPFGYQLPFTPYPPFPWSPQWQMQNPFEAPSSGYPTSPHNSKSLTSTYAKEDYHPYNQENAPSVPILNMPRRPSLVHRTACLEVPQLKSVETPGRSSPVDDMWCEATKAKSVSINHVVHVGCVERRDSAPSLGLKRPVLEHRAASMNAVELRILSTRTELVASEFKRHSSPCLSGLSKIWAAIQKRKASDASED